MDKRQQEAWDQLTQYDAETVMEAFCNYHGLQIFDDNFIDFLEEEGLFNE